MKSIESLCNDISTGVLKDRLIELYGSDQSVMQSRRYLDLLETHKQTYGAETCAIFSSPGRTEIGGNHTDHNHGRVLAAGIDLDMLGTVTPGEDRRVRIASNGWEPLDIGLEDLTARPDERETTAALVRGVARYLTDRGFSIGGFNLTVTSRVLPGSGLSSSASFEVLIGSVLSGLFNNEEIPLTTLAKAGRYAENEYYGKPCGLMDQMACAHGGIIAIDFRDPGNPELTKLSVNFQGHGYRLMVVDTRADHTDLSAHYASIPREMKAVAAHFGKSVCREITMEELLSEGNKIRQDLGDRAYLRAFHFLEETDRVSEQVRALKDGDMPRFLDLVNASGRSSFQYLQNISVPGDDRNQGVAVALAMSEKALEGQGASRVHGGGFAGTILSFVPSGMEADYTAFMEHLFGEGAVIPLAIRNAPAGRVG